MKRKEISSKLIVMCFSLLTVGLLGWAGTSKAITQNTDFALLKEYACLTGGCHETNTNLVQSHSQSVMTHAMVKCNTCHGTHTAAEVGQPKPNLTGYTPGKGATGYTIPKDRCLVCHNAIPDTMKNNMMGCPSCHTPHQFPRMMGGGGGM